MTVYFQSFWVLLSHWKRQPFQFSLFVLGLALATALWSGVQTINYQASVSYKNATNISEKSSLGLIGKKDGSSTDTSTFSVLRKNGWKITPVLKGVIGEEDPISIIGIDPISQINLNNLIDSSKFNQKYFETLVLNRDAIFLNQATYEKLIKAKLDADFQINSNIENNTIIVDISKAELLLNQRGQITYFELTAPPSKSQLLLKKLNLTIYKTNNTTDLKEITKSFHMNLTAFGFLTFFVGLFIINSVINMTFEQRRNSINALRAVGVSIKTLYVCFLIELIILAILGGSLGLALGHAIADILLPSISSTLNNLYEVPAIQPSELSIDKFLIALIMPISGTVAAASTSIWNLSSVKPSSSSKPVQWRKRSVKYLKIQGMVSIGFSLLALFFAFFGSSLFEAFATLACVVISVSLGLPLLIWFFVSLIIRTLSKRSSIQLWFWSDILQQINSVALSLAALLLALSITIGIQTMVKSFRLTFDSWLDQRLVSEFYIKTHQLEDLALVLKKLQTYPEIDTILPIARNQIRYLGKVVKIVGFTPDKIYTDNWPLVSSGAEAWKKVNNGSALFINEQMANRNQLAVGDNFKINIPIPNALVLNLPIAGIYSDYGNPFGQIMIELSVFEKLFPNQNPQNIALKVNPKNTKRVHRLLTTDLQIKPINITNQIFIKQFSKKVFERTFSITNLLSTIIIIISNASIFTTFIILSQIRLVQLGPLWAIGLSKSKLFIIEVLRSLFLILITIVIAIPIGLIVAHILADLINVAAFGWKIPIRYFPFDWLLLASIAMLMSLFATTIPTYLTFRSSTENFIKRFKNDA